jgi:hypothetical protein
MKKISLLLIVVAGLFTLVSCEKAEKGPVVLATIKTPVISAPVAGSSLVMTKPQADLTATFTWAAADYGMPLGTLYTIQMDKAGKKFATAVDVVSVNALTAAVKYSDINTKMVALSTNMEQVNSMAIRIKASVPNSSAKIVYSDSIAMNITPYTAKDNFWMVGAHNGWNNGTAPVFNRNLSGLKYELYVNMAVDNSEFKVLPTLGSWNGDFGDDSGNPGKIVHGTGETNMKAGTAGYYRVDLDMTAMTWKATKYTWGLIGDFNGWGGDQPMTYDAVTNTLKATFDIAAAGGLKFRANGSWDLNYGDNGPDGKLDAGGSNIAIAAAGNYTITLNLNPTGVPQMYTYTVVKN